MKYLLLCLASCGAAQLTPQDKTNLAQYEAQQAACVAANPHDQAAIDACREQVKATWRARWNARFDGGF